MSPQLGKAAFVIAVFITVTSLVMLPFQPRNSAEFVVTVLSAIIGGIMLAIIAVLTRLARR
jgi:cytosine/uracil/thiamine/allantoin permease